MSKAIESAVSEFLASNGYTYAACYVGQVKQDGNWDCDEWRITLRQTETGARMDLPYFTGLGHRKQVQPMPKPAYNPRSIAYEQWAREAIKPQAPAAAGFLSSILMDAEAIGQSFPDWADELGYDSDSIKARTTYEACCVIGAEVRKMFSPAQVEALRELLQDY